MNDDIIYEILKFLPLKDKLNFCCVSKQIKNQYKINKKKRNNNIKVTTKTISSKLIP